MKGDMSPPQSSSTPLSTPDVSTDRGTIGKPALPPKPAVPIKPTPPPRQTQHILPYMEGPSVWTTDSRASWVLNNQTGDCISQEIAEMNAAKASVSNSSRFVILGSVDNEIEFCLNKFFQYNCSLIDHIIFFFLCYRASTLQQCPQAQSPSECLSQNSGNCHHILQKDSMHSVQDALQEALQEADESSNATISPPPPPTTEPPEEVTSFTWRAKNETQSLKSKIPSLKKQPADNSQFLSSGNFNSNSLSMLNNNINSGMNGNNINNCNNNTLHMVSLSRRIEMPPAFLFPENETPPADLIATRDENRVCTLRRQRLFHLVYFYYSSAGSMKFLNNNFLPCFQTNLHTGNALESSMNQDEVDRMMPLGGSECNSQDENNRLQHAPDDTNKCGPNVNDIVETMNNLNTTGPQIDESQPVISETKGNPISTMTKSLTLLITAI